MLIVSVLFKLITASKLTLQFFLYNGRSHPYPNFYFGWNIILRMTSSEIQFRAILDRKTPRPAFFIFLNSIIWIFSSWMLAIGLSLFSLKKWSSSWSSNFFMYDLISGASFRRFMIWVSLALEIPSFRASAASVLTLLCPRSVFWYLSARSMRSIIVGWL